MKTAIQRSHQYFIRIISGFRVCVELRDSLELFWSKILSNLVTPKDFCMDYSMKQNESLFFKYFGCTIFKSLMRGIRFTVSFAMCQYLSILYSLYSLVLQVEKCNCPSNKWVDTEPSLVLLFQRLFTYILCVRVPAGMYVHAWSPAEVWCPGAGVTISKERTGVSAGHLTSHPLEEQ